MACAEQRRRWQCGDRVLVEGLLVKWQSLIGESEGLLDLIYSEILLREERGEAPTLQEYMRRFPEQAPALCRQFDIHAALAAGSLLLSALGGTPSAGPPHLAAGGAVPETAHPRPRGRPSGPLPQTLIPGYELIEVLGRGGMGVVYKARQVALGRVVALKMILHGDHSGPAERERFRIEAEAVGRLQHPNIVQIYQVGEHQGVPFFSLEYCAGGSLDRRLHGSLLSAQAAAALVETLARAIHTAHLAHVVHRDLKPSNVLLAEGPEVPLRHCTPKISDFGLAKKLDAAESGPTGSRGVVGSPPYMAPEQARGDSRAVDCRTDVYALGAILYELLTGRPPFLDASVEMTLLGVLTEHPVPVRRLQPKVPRDLETVCLKCLEKEPQSRYSSALALAEDLRRFRAREPVVARRAGALEWTIKWARRQPAWAALAALALLLLLGTLVAVPLGIAGLRAVANEARADANRMRSAAEAERTRAVCVEWLRQGELAMKRRHTQAKDLEEARRLFINARDRISDQDARDNTHLRNLRADAQRQLNALDRRMQASEDYHAVFRQRDRAPFLLYGGAITGTESDDRLRARKAAHAAVRQALALHGWPDNMPAAVEQAPFGSSRKEALRLGLYEQCVVLAETVAPWPDEPPDQRRQKAAETLDILGRAAALAPGGRVLYLHRARYLALQGDAEAALAERRIAAAQMRRTPSDWFLEGCDLAFEERQLPKALDCFNEALRLQPDLFWAHFFRAVVSQKLHCLAEARSSLAVCAVLQPDFIWTYILRGSLSGLANDFDAAADDFARAEKLLSAEDRSARYVLLVNRGFVALRKREPTKAAALLKEAVGLCPELHSAYVNLAEAYALQEDYVAAVGQMGRAIALQPGLAELYSTRARMQLKRKDSAGALRDLDEAIRLAATSTPRRAQARDHFERALVLYHQHREPQALLACREALALAADDSAAQRLHGEIQMRLGCYEEALAAFDRAGEPSKGGEAAEFFRQRGRARAALHDAPGAVEEYTRAMKWVKDAEMHAARGWAYLDAGAPSLAKLDFEAAIRLNPDHGGSYNGRGLARVQLGDHRGAADAEEALRHGPESWQRRYHAARVFARAAGVVDATRPVGAPQLRTHYQDRAIACLRDALNLYPARERARSASRVLCDPAFLSVTQNSGFMRLLKEYPGNS
jgi:tetratricopeptide (TPR) repeat protein